VPRKGQKHSNAAKEKMQVAALNRDRSSINKMAESQRVRLSKPGARERMSAASRTALADPIVKQKMREKMKKRWEDPEYRERITSRHKKRCSSPEYMVLMSDAAIKRGLNSDYRKNASIGAKKRFESLDERMRIVESRLGGFWYGNLRYYDDRPIYCEKFNRDFRERTRAFRGYVCFECGEPQNGERLHVHHVHYDKKMCCNGSPHDVVPLCRGCHSKTNYNRDYWEDHFTELIYAYDPEGKCYFTKEEMIDYETTTI